MLWSKCLILIGLSCGQFAYAGHQHLHDVADLEEPCQICITVDQFDTALSHSAAVLPADTATVGLSTPLPTLEVLAESRLYGARAPPPLSQI